MRMACISDTHLTVPEFESCSLFPHRLASLPEKEAKSLYEKMRKEIQLAYATCIAWLRKNGPWDLLVHLGDVTGGYGQQGCCHPSAQKIAKETAKDLNGLASLNRWCVGNHDLGYSYPGSLPKSGINTISIDLCRKTFGELFWRHEETGILSIGLCSSIAEYRGADSEILFFQREQNSFLGDALSGHRGPWMLYTHNPLTPKYFIGQISGRTRQLKGMVCGDYHNPLIGRFLKKAAKIQSLPLFSGRQKRVVLECLEKCIFCPSIAPLWWQGYGLVTLSAENGNVKSKETVISRPKESVNIPTSSMMRCFWWIRLSRSICFVS